MTDIIDLKDGMERVQDDKEMALPVPFLISVISAASFSANVW